VSHTNAQSSITHTKARLLRGSVRDTATATIQNWQYGSGSGYAAKDETGRIDRLNTLHTTVNDSRSSQLAIQLELQGASDP